jgi:hypothetical protein
MADGINAKVKNQKAKRQIKIQNRRAIIIFFGGLRGCEINGVNGHRIVKLFT